jgi:hypothetical protein
MENPDDYDIDTDLGTSIDEGDKTGMQQLSCLFPLMVGNEIVSVPSAKNVWNLMIMSNKLLKKKLRLRWLKKEAVRGISNTTPTFLYWA